MVATDAAAVADGGAETAGIAGDENEGSGGNGSAHAGVSLATTLWGAVSMLSLPKLGRTEDTGG
jgi:hypothetical protein